MEQTNKLNWIKKVTPLLYSLSLAGKPSAALGNRICLFPAGGCVLPVQPAAVQKISGGRKPRPHLLGQRCHLCGHLPVDVDFVR